MEEEKEIVKKKEKHIIKFKNPLSIKLDGISLQEIINSYKENNPLDNIAILSSKNLLVSKKNTEFLAVIFIEPIKVIFENVFDEQKYITLELIDAHSTKEIDLIIKDYKIEKANFFSDMDTREDYFNSKFLLYQNSSKEISIKCFHKEYKLESMENVILKNPIDTEKLTKYFNEYFIFPSKTQFEFYESENRKILFHNLQVLIIQKDITKFKIAGPSGEGKSISLIYFSRIYYNVIYLNMKIIYKLYEEKKIEEYLEMIIYEFNRISFDKSDDKTEFEKKFNENKNEPPTKLIEILSEFLKNKNITIIFDQYKEKYTSPKFLENIEGYLNPLFRIVICSSINDKEIGNAVANSLYKNKRQIYLTKDNQDDYFYITNLFDSSNLKKIFSDNNNFTLNNMYESIDYNPKYVKRIKDDKYELKDIEDHILKKMKEHYESLGYDENLYIFNIYSKIGCNIKYEILPLKTISLKYLKLNLDEDTFSIEYKYPIIKKLIEKKIKNIDTKEYFKKKKYNDNELYLDLKGNYFEYDAINHIDKIKNEFFKEKIDYTLHVETIVNMNDNIELTPFENYNIYKNKERIKVKNYLERNLKRIEKASQNMIYDDNINNINYYFYKGIVKEKDNIETFLNKKRENPNKDSSQNKDNKKKTKKGNVKENKDIYNIDLEEDIDYFTYDENFTKGNILVKQKKFNGKELDLGVLLGPKNDKKFIGLQMKFYGEKTNLSSPITKQSIKENISPILLNCLKRYNIKITSWDYIMCLYYNSEDLNQYSESLISNCKNYDLQYIFYNPIENQIYDRNKKPINQLYLDFKSNIDFVSIANPYHFLIDTGFLDDYSEQSQNSIDISIGTDIFGEDLETFRKKINKSIEKNIIPICKFKLVPKSNFPIPKNFYMLVFKKKENLLYYYNLDNELFIRELNNLNTNFYPCFISSYLPIELRSKEFNIEFFVFRIENK